MAKRLVSLLVLCGILLGMLNVGGFASRTQPEYESITYSFSGGTAGQVPAGWSGVNFVYGNPAGGYYGQVCNHKIGQGWGATGYLIYNNYAFTGDLIYSATFEGYDTTNSETDHRSHMIFNYQDVENYYYIDFGANPTSGSVKWVKKQDNVDTVIATREAAGVGTKPGITATVTYNAAAKTVTVTATKKDNSVVTIFENEADTTATAPFVGGKVGIGAKSSSFTNFTNISVKGMALDTTPEPPKEISYKLSETAERTTYAPNLPTSGALPEWWKGTNYQLGTWGNFIYQNYNQTGYLTYGRYEWEQEFTYRLRMSNYETGRPMASAVYFLWKDKNNHYGVEFYTAVGDYVTDNVHIIKTVDGVKEILAKTTWQNSEGKTISLADHQITLIYNAGKITVKTAKGSTDTGTLFENFEDPSPSFTSGQIGFGNAVAIGGQHVAGINVTGMAREWVPAGEIAFPERPKTMRKLPTITSATEVPVPQDLQNRVLKTYPEGLLKAFVIDFDDGTQAWCEGFDTRAIEVLNKYNARGTFNLSGDKRSSGYTEAELDKYASMYKNHEVAIHQMTHTEPADLTDEQLEESLSTAKGWFEQITARWGYPLPTTETEGLALAQVGGWAYPGGGKDIRPSQIAVAESLGVKYGRRSTVNSGSGAYNVKLPNSFFNWKATCSLSTAAGTDSALDYQKTYIASDLNYMTAFYCWNHAWDIWVSAANQNDKSEKFETLIKNFALNADTIWNPGVLELVDYVNASRQLEVSENASGNIVLYNPSNAIDVWARVDYVNVMVPAGATITVGEDLQPEQTPQATINFTAERIEGLVANAAYTVNGAAVTADAQGQIAIEAAWLNSSISIVKKGDGAATSDSEEQVVAIPGRPAAPSVSAIAPTTEGGTGGIDGTTVNMEYRTGQGTWKACSAGSTTGLVPAQYEVRIKATEAAFAGVSATVTVPVYQAPVVKEIKIASFDVTTNASAWNYSVDISNTTGTPKDVTVVVALYDVSNGNILAGLVQKTFKNFGSTDNFSGSFSIKAGSTYLIRAFLWDGIDTMRPIDAKSFSK